MAKDESGDPLSKAGDGAPPTKPVDAPTARRRQDAIGRRLRQMYEDVVREDVPTDFMQFLKDADERGGSDPSTPGGGKPPGK